MKESPLISIVVPTYNRSDLIPETIESIRSQTYQNWECMIVDDGSKDGTREVVEKFSVLDSRIKYLDRPDTYKPGGNGARNYGLDNSNGDYIVFFDSDDLMTPDHLEVKVELVEDGHYDFGVTRTKFFNHSNDKIDKYYTFTTADISKENYILQKINWLTLDIIIKSTLAKSVRFNEEIRTGQEYNYFSKMLCRSDKGIFKDSTVSLRRYHSKSKAVVETSGKKKYIQRAIKYWKTFIEVKNNVNSNVRKHLLMIVYNSLLNLKMVPESIESKRLWKNISQQYGFQAFYMYSYYHISKHSTRFHFLRKRALKSIG